MSLLLPLGLLGLLSIIGLILIYIIKPNYQQKFISSTYVWKLSLKYRKKKIPVNRLKNIILFIIQLLILISCAFLLARPVIPTQKVQLNAEKVVILDASASMLVKNGQNTRFERAVSGAKELIETVSNEKGVVSVILADDEPRFLFQREDFNKGARVADINDELDKLATLDESMLPSGCSYASADMEAAAALAEYVLLENPETEVVLYTGTNYINKGKYTVVNVAADDNSEWNAAVLDCAALLIDNYYTFTADVGCFGTVKEVRVFCEIYNYNGSGQNITLNPKSEMFTPDENKKTITFTPDDQMQVNEEAIYSFDSARLYVQEADSLEVDNTFWLYSGKRSKLKIQYASSKSNKFVTNAVQIAREVYKAKYDVELSIIREGATFATEGFDMYIFEHERMPQKMPTDGLVMLLDPASSPENSGIRVSGTVRPVSTSTLSSGEPHPLTRRLVANEITLAKYSRIISHDGFEELMYYGNDPVLLAKNTPTEKIVVLALDLNYSNLALDTNASFPFFMNNVFSYYFPSTLARSTYQVGETVSFNPRGTEFKLVSGPGIGAEGVSFEELPATFRVTQPGPYTVEQLTLKNELIQEQFYVGIAKSESEITKEIDALPILNITRKEELEDKDLLIYIAAALVALLFVEWWLQSREYF